MRRQRRLEFGDRRVQLRDVGDRRFGGDAVSVFEKWWLRELFASKDLVDPSDALVEQTSTTGLAQCRLDAGLGQHTTLRGRRSDCKNRHRVGPGKLCAKGFEGPG